MTDSGCEDTAPSADDLPMPAIKMPDESDATMRKRLFNSLSQSFPHSQLYKALHGGEDIILNGGDNDNSDSDDDSLYGDHLSNSCFASLRMDRRDSDDFDDDLQSLEWLQSEDLLKNIGGQKLDDDGEEQKENEDVKPDINVLNANMAGQQPAVHPYLPQKHVNSKPPYSFSCLIFMAVENSPKKMLPVKDIYNWILKQFPYFQNAPTGWKNSVRHNLSLNKCFKKVEKDKGQSIGKGSLWCIDPAYRPNLLQALRKTPYHPYHQLQMTSTQPPNYINYNMQYQCLPSAGRTVLPLTQRPIPNTVSPHLFPFLSRRLAQTSFDIDSDIKDVAQTLVALKTSFKKETPDSSPGEDIGPTWKFHKRSYSYNNNSRKRPSSPVTVTNHPCDDHTYSSSRLLDDDLPSPSSSSSIDEEYDFGDADDDGESYDSEWDSDDKDEVDGDLPSTKRLKIDMDRGKETSKKTVSESDDDDEEQKKIHEGANALLNLAGFLLGNRSSSNTSNEKDDKEEGEEPSKKRFNSEKKNVKKKKAVELEKRDKSKEKSGSKSNRGTSRRKNAGNNGKYDSDEYSLLKPKKSSSGSMKTKTSGEPKSAPKPGSSKSMTDLSNSASKVKDGLNKSKKKSSISKKKLKLSKNFGVKKDSPPSSKVSSLLSKKNSKSKTDTPGKKTSKKAKLKAVQDEDEIKQEAASPGDVSKVNNNNNDVDKDNNPFSVTVGDSNQPIKQEILSPEEKAESSQEPQPPTPRFSTVDEPKSSEDSPERSACRSLSQDFLAAMGLKEKHPKENSNYSVAKNNTSKNGLYARSLPASTTGSPVAAHRSPHFTRFSKKKKL